MFKIFSEILFSLVQNFLRIFRLKIFFFQKTIFIDRGHSCKYRFGMSVCFFFNQSLIFVHKFPLPRALLALRQCLPDQLRDITFATCLQEDQSTKHWLNQLLKNLETGPQQPPTQPGQPDPRTIGMSPLTS